jgi:hypothetical protein
MKKIVSLLAVSSLSMVLFSSVVQAECYCACINNKETKVCENSYDANYVYCSGSYCSGALDIPKESPFQSDELKNLFSSLGILQTNTMPLTVN